MNIEARLEDEEIRAAIQQYLAARYNFSLKGFDVPKVSFVVTDEMPGVVKVAANVRGVLLKKEEAK